MSARFVERAALGCLLVGLLVLGIWQTQRPAVDYPSAAEIAALQRGVAFSSHHQPDAQDTRALITAELDRRRLFAEALRRGLHRQDPMVRERLLEDAAFFGITGSDDERLDALVSQGLVQQDAVIRERLIARLFAEVRTASGVPTDTELRRQYEATPQRWVVPARWQLRLLAFNGADAVTRAAQALQQLRAGQAEGEVQADNPAAQRELPLKSAPRLAAQFGEALLAALPTTPDLQWQGPIRSRLGAVLVRVRDYQPPQPMDFTAARGLLVQERRERQNAAAQAAFLDTLRQRYRVRGS